jgi:hypothetical protein
MLPSCLSCRRCARELRKVPRCQHSLGTDGRTSSEPRTLPHRECSWPASRLCRLVPEDIGWSSLHLRAQVEANAFVASVLLASLTVCEISHCPDAHPDAAIWHQMTRRPSLRVFAELTHRRNQNGHFIEPLYSWLTPIVELQRMGSHRWLQLQGYLPEEFPVLRQRPTFYRRSHC